MSFCGFKHIAQGIVSKQRILFVHWSLGYFLWPISPHMCTPHYCDSVTPLVESFYISTGITGYLVSTVSSTATSGSIVHSTPDTSSVLGFIPPRWMPNIMLSATARLRYDSLWSYCVPCNRVCQLWLYMASASMSGARKFTLISYANLQQYFWQPILLQGVWIFLRWTG